MSAFDCTAKPVKYIGSEGDFIEPPDKFGNVRFACEAFEEGKFRRVHKGRVTLKDTDSPWLVTMILNRLQHVLGDCWPQAAKGGHIECVVKTLKRESAMESDMWTPDLKVLRTAVSLAKRFNKFVLSQDMAPLELRRPIKFCSGFLFKVVEAVGSDESVRIDELVLVEPYLNGTYKKMNSNSGWAERVAGGPELSEGAQLAAAFSHWTWHETKDDEDQLLLCGIQGVFKDGAWLLTDPAAHSRVKGMMGRTDLGNRGVNKFFTLHKCNGLCEGLSKPDVFADPGFKTTNRTVMELEVPDLSCTVHTQIGGTCYAHAVATIIRATEKSMGRALTERFEITDHLTEKYGVDGANVETALALACQCRKMTYRKIDMSATFDVLKGCDTSKLGHYSQHFLWVKTNGMHLRSSSLSIRRGH